MSMSDPPPPTNTSAMAALALVFGLLALVLCWVPVVGLAAFPFGVFGIIFALLGLRATRQSNVAGRGLAFAALTTGGLGVFVASFLFATFLRGFSGPAWEDDWAAVKALWDQDALRH